MTPIEAIVFDFDGVIVDSEPLYEKAEKELFALYGVDIDIEDLKDTKGLSEKMYLSIIRERYRITAPIEELSLKGRAILKRYFAAELNYIPGFSEFLKKFSPLVKTGLATSSSRDLMNWIFDNTKVRNHFLHSVTADDVVYSKPHPEPYLKICHIIGVKPDNAIVIEDSANGLQSAKAAGAVTIGFHSNSSSGNFPNADYRASDYRQVETHVMAIIEERKVK